MCEKEDTIEVSFECGPKERCQDGGKHDYRGWEQSGPTGTAVCLICGHRAIDDAYWLDV